jgi:coenzyme F420-reducing hydrogenase delta subunit
MNEETLQMLGVAAIAVLLFALMFKMTKDIEKSIGDSRKDVHRKMQELEDSYEQMHLEVERLHSSVDSKVDQEHFDRKLDGLTKLLQSAKKK